MKIDHIKDLIQSCNINFLIGSGCSVPYLSTLHNIENLLTDLDNQKAIKPKNLDLIKASIYKVYCEDVIFKNLNSFILTKGKEGEEIQDEKYSNVLNDYKKLLLGLNEILLYKHNTLQSKQVNLFTTNIDLFLEKALEETRLEANDGFKGRIKPTYDLSNFHKSYSKTSSHYDNISEIPVFNLLKVHGSINWKNENKNILACNTLEKVETVKKKLDELSSKNIFLKIDEESTISILIAEAEKIKEKDIPEFSELFDAYNHLLIVNPTKSKFEKTLFDEQFYELLRIFANSLEKENTLLFVLGFSFADEHIRDITIRAANSNPTLQVIIFAHKNEDGENISKELQFDMQNVRNNNIIIITPEKFIDSNSNKDEIAPILADRLVNFDCETITTEIFNKVKDTIRLNKKRT